MMRSIPVTAVIVILVAFLLLLVAESFVASATARERACSSVAAQPMASTVLAVNMSCRRARQLVASTTRNNRKAPRGWVYINPAGCEGFIVRTRDRGGFIKRQYRFQAGASGVRSNIYRGCRS